MKQYLSPKNYYQAIQSLFYQTSENIVRYKQQREVQLLKTKYKERVFLQQTSINGIDMLVFANNSIGRQILVYKKYESISSAFLQSVVHTDWVCFDIGANVGYYSLLLGKLAYRGEIHSFEPNNLEYCVFSTNIALNSMDHILPLNYAVSNSDGETLFKISEDSGFSSFKDTKRQTIIKTVPVKTVTLDTYIQQKGITRIDFMKIDVEGAELLVLEGSKKVMKELKPKIMLIEICQENLKAFQTNGNVIIDLLHRFHYSPFYIKNNKLVPWANRTFGNSNDLVFVHESYRNKLDI